MSLVFTQILVILLYVMIGFVAGKVKLINPEQRKYLSSICSNLILPFTILSAASQQVTAQEMRNIGIAMALMGGMFGLSTLLSLVYHNVKKADPGVKAAITGLITFPNCTFLGLPLCTVLFGNIAILYNVSAILMFNVLFFTVQYTLFTGKKFDPRNLLSTATVSTVLLLVMIFMGLHFPKPVETVIGNTGAMITPLSLIIIGVMMSESDLLTVLKEKKAYIVTLLRNLVIPALAMLILLLIPMDSQSKLCILVYIACPCGTLTAVYAIQNNMEPELCARTILMSTIFFAATLPIVISVGQLVLG